MENREYFFSLYKALSRPGGVVNDNLVTKAVIEELIEYEDGMAGDIKNYMEIKDEAKRIHELAEYIRLEYIENCEVKDEKIDDNDAKEFLDHVMYSVDCYDVAKALIDRYKKQKGLTNRKSKKNLSLVKKSA